jgi:translocation and assembly module TamA
VSLRSRNTALLLVLLIAGASAPNAQAPDAQAPDARAPEAPASDPPPAPTSEAEAERVLAYTVEFVPTGDAALDRLLPATSQLERLREPAPTDALGVLARARGDLPRLETVLRSEGYYAGRIDLTVAGEPLGAPGLDERLARAAGPVPIRVQVEPGPRYRIDTVRIEAAAPGGAGPVRAATAEPFGLAPGDPARAEAVLDAESALLDRLRDAGHPLAASAGRDVVVDHARRTMDVALTLAPGPRAAFAPPVVTGEERTDSAWLRRVAGRLTDQPYSPRALERARRDLLGLGVFGSVRATTGDALDATGRLPVTFTVEERPLRAIGATVAYETNYGFTGSVYWEHRNLFGGAERLRLEAELSRVAEDRPGEIGYRIGGSLRSPFLYGRDLTMIADAFLIRERLDAYDRDAFETGLLFERRVTEALVLQAGPTFEVGRVGRDGNWDDYELIGLNLGLRYDTTDDPLDPTRGLRAGVALTPYYELAESQSFTRLRLTASTYWDILGDRRSILALRGAVGSIVGASRDEVPLHKRFYAGGGGSVRGYAYQSIGPRDASDRPIGGTSLVEGSIELRQQVWGNFGAAVFVDAGSVGTNEVPDFSDLRVGVGVGLRYRTAIGPLRADIAVPLNRVSGDSSFGLYVGLGQAF